MKKIIVILICVFTTDLAFSQIRYNYNKNKSTEISYSSPKEYEIAEIKVEGAKYLDHIALVSLSGLKVGDQVKVPGDDITGAIKKLWKQGLMGDVAIYASKIEGSKIYLTIKLTERPRLSKIEYSGINGTQETDIDDKIKLIRGRVLTDAIIKNTELTVKKHFVEKGFLNTAVKISRKKDTTLFNHVKLFVDVDKKNKVKINSVTFEGNENFPDSRLKKKLKSTKEHARVGIFKTVYRSIFAKNKIEKLAKVNKTNEGTFKTFLNDNFKLNFFNGSKYIQSDFKDDKAKLIEFYNSKGYRDAKVVTDTISNFDSKTIDLKVYVEEGNKYYFRDIIWEGNYVHKDETLRKILGITKGDVYDLELINKRLNYNPNGADVSSLYMDNGYLFFNVQPVELRIEGDSIDVEMRINEGTQATINKVIIKGNDRTNDHVILREIRTLPGQKFSREQLIRTNRELGQLGYFDPEQIGMNPIPNPVDGSVDIEYTLVEKPSDQIELSGGWGGAFGFVGTLGLVFNNFSIKNIPDRSKWHPLPVGDGQKLALRLQANGKRFQNYSFTFSEPWLGGKKPNALTISVNKSIQRTRTYYREEDGVTPLRDTNGQLIYPSSFNDFNAGLKLTSLSVGLGRRLRWPDDYFFIQNSLSYSIYDLNNYDLVRDPSGNIENNFSNGKAHNFTFNTTIARNSAGPNPMYPQQGSSLTLNMSFTPPYSVFNNLDYANASQKEKFKNIEYHKWMFDAKFYTKVIDKLVIESRAHFGFIGSYTDKAGTGPFERFIMGGSGLGGQNFLIGNDIIGLRGYEDNSVIPINSEFRGGVAYNKFSMELRYPISLNPSATIYVLAFGEAGNNWGSFKDYNLGDLNKSAGFGARIFMPAFGLIGIDWAYGFDTLPGQTQPSGAQFHFTIGQQLR